MLFFLSVLIVLAVAYAHCREGVLTAATLLINVVLAGILTFHFWEPLADALEQVFAGGSLVGYEDTFSLTILFTVFLILLRMATATLAPRPVDFSNNAQLIGGGLFGLVTGYLTAGFLVCVLQTLPWHENFLGFQPRTDGETSLRSFFPPDRVWLALMRHAAALPLAWQEDREDAATPYERQLTFDGDGTFELRYLRYRRRGDNREPLKYDGELDRELRKEKPR